MCWNKFVGLLKTTLPWSRGQIKGPQGYLLPFWLAESLPVSGQAQVPFRLIVFWEDLALDGLDDGVDQLDVHFLDPIRGRGLDDDREVRDRSKFAAIFS